MFSRLLHIGNETTNFSDPKSRVFYLFFLTNRCLRLLKGSMVTATDLLLYNRSVITAKSNKSTVTSNLYGAQNFVLKKKNNYDITRFRSGKNILFLILNLVNRLNIFQKF